MVGATPGNPGVRLKTSRKRGVEVRLRDFSLFGSCGLAVRISTLSVGRAVASSERLFVTRYI